ncbi:MAG: hemerythrin domain-containing protein [Bradymonadaceae bacterium]
MVDEELRSDLIDIVHHEHDHLKRLFDDIADSFEQLADDRSELESDSELLASAADELEVALDEMLHHFSQEEEVFFVDLKERFPELADDIDGLADAHETMCEKTRWLKSEMGASPAEVVADLDEILDVLREMAELLTQHTREENRVFGRALEKMPREEQRALLEEMRKL